LTPAEHLSQVNSRVRREYAHDGRPESDTGDAELNGLMVVGLEAPVLSRQQHRSHPIAQKEGEQSGSEPQSMRIREAGSAQGTLTFLNRRRPDFG